MTLLYTSPITTQLDRSGMPFAGWTPLSFGRYEGKTLPQVLFIDPDWFFWALDQQVFAADPARELQAEMLRRRARSIKIPNVEGRAMSVEYIVDRRSGKFSEVRLHDASTGLGEPVLDLSAPRRFCRYDKRGCRNLVKQLKGCLLGDLGNMTKERCEAFYDHLENFALDAEASHSAI